MAGQEVSVHVATDAKKAAADFDFLSGSVKRLNAEAKALGLSFGNIGTGAERGADRATAAIRRTRQEIERTNRTARSGPLFGGGLSNALGSLPGGGLAMAAVGTGSVVGGALTVAGVGAAAFGSIGYQQARQQIQSESVLQQAVKRTSQSYAEQMAEVAGLRRELGLTTAQATQLQAATLRFTGTIGKPESAGKLARALANALAAAGRSSEEIPDRLTQLSTGQDELFDVLGPVKIGKTYAGSPEAIYKAYAREILNVNRELTDLEKTQARYYAVLQAGGEAEGAAAERMRTQIGQIDVLTNRFNDLAGAAAKAALGSKGVSLALDGISHSVKEIDNFAQTKQGAKALQQGAVAALIGPVGAALYYQAFPYDEGPPAAVDDQRAPDIKMRYKPRTLWGDGRAKKFATRLKAGLNARYEEGRARELYEAGLEAAGSQTASLIGQAGAGMQSAVEYGDRLADFQRTSGTVTDVLNRRRWSYSYGETTQERAARVFSTADKFGSAALATLKASGAFTGAEAGELASAAERQFLIKSLGNVKPGDLTADQKAAYEDALMKAQEDALKAAIDTLSNVVKIEKNLSKLAGKLAPNDVVEPEPVVIQLDNRADVIAKFAASTYSSGDSLRSDQ